MEDLPKEFLGRSVATISASEFDEAVDRAVDDSAETYHPNLDEEGSVSMTATLALIRLNDRYRLELPPDLPPNLISELVDPLEKLFTAKKGAASNRQLIVGALQGCLSAMGANRSAIPYPETDEGIERLTNLVATLMEKPTRGWTTAAKKLREQVALVCYEQSSVRPKSALPGAGKKAKPPRPNKTKASSS